MKTLYLMRHAKSSWDFPELRDHDRPLNKRGRQDAPLMGQQLLSRDVQPDLILTSTAVRALSTATLVAKELGYEMEKLQTESRIYGAEKRELLQLIKEVPDQIDKLLFVGHNFPISELANLLSPEAVPEMPTAGVVGLRFECNTWLDISADNAELLFFDFPKNYKNKKKDKDKDKDKGKGKDKEKEEN
ncbi:MAG TPA: histidine phosphatase family protein [Adhaeribacter sp.]|nr:histidine phosphatase family protein [Adhaeribacter sp.]